MKRLVLPWAAGAVLLLTCVASAEDPKPQPPASQPDAAALSPAVKELVGKLKDGIGELSFRFSYGGNSDKPFYNVTLSVPDIWMEKPQPFDAKERITADQARRIIDLLAAAGWLDRHGEHGPTDTGMPELPGYTLWFGGVLAKDRRVIYCQLGFDLKMLRLMDGVKALVEGDAAKAMGLLIGRMSGLRAQWEAAEPKPPASQAAEGAPAELDISIDVEGTIRIGGQKVDSAGDVTKHVPSGTERAVIVADKKVQWRLIQEVMTALSVAKVTDVRLRAPK